ncbi:MAG TPA: hypothetical protein VFS18_05275 [Actinomycetota bacterium]|nr:hypothetical protein [Actinomycetota bacterium]
MTAWELARATGFLAYLAFTASTVAGLMLSSKYLGKKAGRNLTLVHEAAAIAGLVVVVLHAWAILNDSFFEFDLASILVPGMSPYDPLWVGMGVFAAWVGAIVIGSFYVRKKIGPRNWRRIHYLSPIMFVAMTMHGLMAGTDSQNTAALALYSAGGGSALALTGYRIVVGMAAARKKKAKAAKRAAAPASAVSAES